MKLIAPRSSKPLFLWKQGILFAYLIFLAFNFNLGADEVKTYTRDFILKSGDGAEITQKRWYLENESVRLGVIDDPGGAIVEFTNKTNGVNHVAGDAYKSEKEGKLFRKAGWGWIEFIYDESYDPKEKWMYYQPFTVSFSDGVNGAKSIRATGRTDEQQIERVMTLQPGSPELTVDIRLTNISDHQRPLWLRWHPQIFPSKDIQGEHCCVLSPGEGNEVRKIRTSWGWDHWFSTVHGFWLCADFSSGDGLFCTFEKEKIPIHFTWTQYKKGTPTSGAVTMEPFPEVKMFSPGESVENRFTYYPFNGQSKPEQISLTIDDKNERSAAEAFLKRALPLSHLKMFGAYTFANSIQFPWGHLRRDKFGLADWGFADCAIMGYPYQDKPVRIRLIGGLFPDADMIKGLKKWENFQFHISVKDRQGVSVYDHIEKFNLFPGVPGADFIDREIPVPMNGVPDGTYSLKVEALDPINWKPFHSYERNLDIFGNRLNAAEEKLASIDECEMTADRPFVTALSKIKDTQIKDGKVIVPIGVEDGSGVKREGFPVTLGVPFPEGAFKKNVLAKLLSPDGKVVAAQFEVMNIWPDQSLKWLRVDFQADCPPNGYVFYNLNVGDGIKPDEIRTEKLISEKGDRLEVKTGPMFVVIDKNRLSIPGEIRIDYNHDGKFTDDELITQNPVMGSAWWKSSEGKSYVMTCTGGKSLYFNPGVQITSNGPLVASVTIQGWYSDSENIGRPAYGEIRLTFFKDKAWLNIEHQVTFTGSPWRDKLASYGINLNFAKETFKSASFDVDGKAFKADKPAELYQESPDSLILKVDGKSSLDGGRSDGGVVMQGDGKSVLVYHRNLWQMYPKKVAADAGNGRITVHYWPEDAGVHSFAPDEEYWIPSSSSAEACGTGASRTQELVLDFSGTIDVCRAKDVYSEPVVAAAPPSWVQKSATMGNLQPYNPASVPEVENFIKLYLDFILRNRDFFKFYGHWDYGTVHNVINIRDYKWLLVGRYANIGNEEDIVQAPWLLYFRSGDRRYLKLAESWTRHLMEVQSIRWHNTYPQTAGMSRRHHYTPWMGDGDFGHTMLCQYLEYYHATGYRPAWQMALMTAEAMANTWDGTWRYISNPIIGNTRMYLETGDEKYRKVADRVWRDLCDFDRNDWWGASHGARMACWYAPLNENCMKAWKEWSKEGVPNKKIGEYPYPFRNVDALAAMGDLSGDSWFAHQARLEFDSARSKGMINGNSPIYRGYIPYTMNTQSIMGLCRTLATGKGQIAKSNELFPAGLYNLGDTLKKVIIKEDKDQSFKIRVSGNNEKVFKVIAPDGKPAKFAIKEICKTEAGTKTSGFYEITVDPDGQTGIYQMPSFPLIHFGCDLEKSAFVVGNILQGAGEPLYVKSDSLHAPDVDILIRGSPSASIELFSMAGKRLFSKTLVRPPEDAVAVECSFKVPTGELLRMGDHNGVEIRGVKEIILYPNKEGIFDVGK